MDKIVYFRAILVLLKVWSVLRKVRFLCKVVKKLLNLLAVSSGSRIGFLFSLLMKLFCCFVDRFVTS